MSTHLSVSPQWISDLVGDGPCHAVLVPAAPHGPCGPTSRSPVPDSAAWFPSSAGDSFPGTLVTTGLLRPPWSGFPCPAPVELRCLRRV